MIKPTEEVKKIRDERISTKIVLLGERVREKNLLYNSHVKKSGQVGKLRRNLTTERVIVQVAAKVVCMHINNGKGKEKKKHKAKNPFQAFIKFSLKPTHRCLILFKFENDSGIVPDMLFRSTWSLFKLYRYPSSAGKEPDSLFPFKRLHKQHTRG